MDHQVCEGCVLIVEDDRDLRDVLREHIEARLGCRVVVAVDGVEALTYLNAPDAVSPCVIVSDLNMPRLGGVGLVRCVRSMSHHDGARIVTMSGERQREQPPEVELHLDKPFSFTTLAATITSACRGGPARDVGTRGK